MIANISWNIACACSGIVAPYAASGSKPTPLKPSQASPPPGSAVSERDGVADQHPLHTDHASATTLIIIVLRAFLGRTRPP